MLSEMSDARLDLAYIEKVPNKPTLFSFCFIYPDGSGGNMTTDNSACGEVDAEYVHHAIGEFDEYGRRGIALAVPEVPLEARIELLNLATQHGMFRIASFTSEEIREAKRKKLFLQIDLLALNIDEAAALGLKSTDPKVLLDSAVQEARRLNPDMLLTITSGSKGSWSWNGSALRHIPAFPVKVAGTSGAGDAFLSGVIAGLAEGLPFHEAHRLGALVGALSVTSPHTINKDINRRSLFEFSKTLNIDISPELMLFLEAAE